MSVCSAKTWVILFVALTVSCAAGRARTGACASVVPASMGEEALQFSEIVIKTHDMPMSVATGDFNHDGFADFALLNEGSGLMWTYSSLPRSRHFKASRGIAKTLPVLILRSSGAVTLPISISPTRKQSRGGRAK